MRDGDDEIDRRTLVAIGLGLLLAGLAGGGAYVGLNGAPGGDGILDDDTQEITAVLSSWDNYTTSDYHFGQIFAQDTPWISDVSQECSYFDGVARDRMDDVDRIPEEGQDSPSWDSFTLKVKYLTNDTWEYKNKDGETEKLHGDPASFGRVMIQEITGPSEWTPETPERDWENDTYGQHWRDKCGNGED